MRALMRAPNEETEWGQSARPYREPTTNAEHCNGHAGKEMAVCFWIIGEGYTWQINDFTRTIYSALFPLYHIFICSRRRRQPLLGRALVPLPSTPCLHLWAWGKPAAGRRKFVLKCISPLCPPHRSWRGEAKGVGYFTM